MKAGFVRLNRRINGHLALGYLEPGRLQQGKQQRYPTTAATENQPFELSMKLEYDSAGYLPWIWAI
jgi:hypothetical protein